MPSSRFFPSCSRIRPASSRERFQNKSSILRTNQCAVVLEKICRCHRTIIVRTRFVRCRFRLSSPIYCKICDFTQCLTRAGIGWHRQFKGFESTPNANRFLFTVCSFFYLLFCFHLAFRLQFFRILLLLGQRIELHSIVSAHTKLMLSLVRSIIDGLINAGLDYVGTVMQKILPEMQPEVVSSPLFQRMPPVYGQLDTSFRDYVAPALVLAVTYAMSVGLTALAFVQERKEGLFERSLVSGVNTIHIFFAHFIVEFCMVLIQTVVMYFFMFSVFKVPIYGSVLLAVALTLAQGQFHFSSSNIRSF